MEKHIKTIGILTSGGDSPGMNAAIRAVTRTARFNNINVIGIQRGYQGLIDKEFLKFTSSSVSNTIQRGGTILKTARCKDFMTPSPARNSSRASSTFPSSACPAPSTTTCTGRTPPSATTPR